MQRLYSFLLTLVLPFLLNSPVQSAQFTLGPHNFTLPDGFTIEIAAPASLAPRPVEADFDENGRLYVTDSAGVNDNVKKQLVDKPHRILRLEDTDADGIFDKSVVFADKLMFPEGCLWHDGSLYVSAPPSIWKLTDTNNDGMADVRVEWFKGESLGGCANDLHGPYLGPDGWIYWCKGGFEKQTHTLGTGKTFTSRASHIWRARPDGSGLEPIMTGGMDNPVGLTWSPEGELFLCGTFFQHPGGGKRDGIIHVIYGGVYGKENDVLEGHPRTGELMPIMTHLGPAAPCGIARYESGLFGVEYRDNLFVCNFNLHKISRHVLKPSGSTFVTTDSDFLVSDNTDFHPTDVFEDADGSLLVVDTGGWYKLCCPTSQLHKPDVLGAIYRIRRKGAPGMDDPRGLKLAWDQMNSEELAKLLGDKRPAVVLRAGKQLAGTSGHTASLLAGLLSSPAPISRNAIWALTRNDTRLAREIVRSAIGLGGTDSSVRLAAAHSVSLWRDANAVQRLANLLQDEIPAVRRVAAEALGRIGDKQYSGSLMAAFDTIQPEGKQDRCLEHALTYAFIESGDPEITARYIEGHSSRARGALIALDQMPGGNLKPDQVTPLLASTNVLLKQTANWIVGHHPEWAGALAGFLKERIAVPNLSDSERADLQQQLARFIGDASVQAIVAATAANTSAPPAIRNLGLRVMGGSKFKQVPPDWDEAINLCIRGSDIDVQREAIRAARVLPKQSSKIESALAGRFKDVQSPDDIRLEALAARQPLRGLDSYGFNYVLCHAATTNTIQLRGLAAAVLSSVPLSDDQLFELAGSLRELSPLEVTRLLPAFRRCTNDQVGFHLTSTLKSLRYLQPSQVRPNLTNFPDTVRAKAEKMLATLNTDAARQQTQLDELSTKLALNFNKPDIRRGQAIFNGQKAACSTCHAIGYLGGNLGPDLTKIGTVRTERDLLESIVFPSASFVRSFEPMLVVTKSGEEQSGILRRDAPDEVVLATGPNTELRIARADIAEMRPGTVSVMPQGLDTILSRQELADLLAFLKATKW